MKIAVLALANDEVCVCSRCQKDGRANSYVPMVEAMRKTWAGIDDEDIKVFYIYGHREGIEFPDNSKYIFSNETYWPVSRSEGGEGVNIVKKRSPFAIGDCIYSDTPEGRENIYYKTVDGFQWLLENEDFDYVVRCCIGTYIDLKILKSFLNELGPKDNIYCGSTAVYNNDHMNNKTEQPKTIKYASGSGFVASRNLIKDLVLKRNFVDIIRSRYASATIADDPTFGHHFMNFCGVEDIISWQKMEFSHPGQITESVKDYLQCYFRHTINPDMLYAVHKAKGLQIK